MPLKPNRVEIGHNQTAPKLELSTLNKSVQ